MLTAYFIGLAIAALIIAQWRARDQDTGHPWHAPDYIIAGLICAFWPIALVLGFYTWLIGSE